MLRGLIFCAMVCGIAAPVAAGERRIALPATRAIAAPILPVSLEFPSHDGGLTIGGDFVIRFGDAPVSRVTLADFENRTVPRFDMLSVEAAPAIVVSSYAATSPTSLAAWRLTDGLAPTTTNANGLYAVRDQLDNYRKPRVFRPTPLSAMLVLRIDGKTDSPPLSIGGGGVAAVLWGILPQ